MSALSQTAVDRPMQLPVVVRDAVEARTTLEGDRLAGTDELGAPRPP